MCGGGWGSSVAVPEKEGHPAFTPSKWATFVVAGGLFGCAVLVTALAGWLVLPVNENLLSCLGFSMAAVFLVRAIGDFRLVDAAVLWAIGRGLAEIKVRTNVTRREAHAFYFDLGFHALKTQTVFSMAIQAE